MLASPHAFYGPGSDALSLTMEYAKDYDPTWEPPTTTTTTPSSLLQTFTNGSEVPKGGGMLTKIQVCQLDGRGNGRSDCDAADSSKVPLVLIFISQFIMGIGVLLFFTLGGELPNQIQRFPSSVC